MNETVSADLNIELNVQCPHCDEFFDLFHFEDERLNDDCELIKACCPSKYQWMDHHKKYKKTVKCPECTESINIEGITW